MLKMNYFCCLIFLLILAFQGANSQKSYSILIAAPSFVQTDEMEAIIQTNFLNNKFNRKYEAALKNTITFSKLKINLLQATLQEILEEKRRLEELNTIAIIQLADEKFIGKLSFLNLMFPTNTSKTLASVPIFTNILPPLVSNNYIAEDLLKGFLTKEPIKDFSEHVTILFIPNGYNFRVAEFMKSLKQVMDEKILGFTNIVYYKDSVEFLRNMVPPETCRFISLLSLTELDTVLTMAIKKNFLQPQYSWIVLNLFGTRNILDRNRNVISSQNKVILEFSHVLNASIGSASSLHTILEESSLAIMEYLRYVLTGDAFINFLKLEKTGNAIFELRNNEFKIVKSGFNVSVYHGIGEFKRLKSSFIIEQNGKVRQETWNLEKLFPPKTLSLEDFKISVRKTSLKVLAIKEDPFVIQKPGIFNNPNDAFTGYYVDIFKEIMKRLEFKYVITPWDGSFGIQLNNGSWNGALNELLNAKYDVLLGDYAIISSRLKYFDFMNTRTSYSTFVHNKLPNRDDLIPTLFMFILPFHWKVWATIGGTIAVVSLGLFIINALAKTFDPGFSLFESFYFTIGCIFQGVTNVPPKTFAGKIIACVWWFCAIIIVVVYIANFCVLWLDNQMALQKNITHKEILSERNSSIGYYPSSSTEMLYRASMSANLRRVYYLGEIYKDKNLFNSEELILERLKSDINYYFIMSLESGQKMASRYCHTNSGKVDFYEAGFAVRKGESLKTIFDAELLKLTTERKLDEFANEYFKFETNASCGTGSIGAVLIQFSQYLPYIPGNAMPFYAIFMILIIVVGSYLLFFVFGLFELCIMRNQYKKNEKGTNSAEI